MKWAYHIKHKVKATAILLIIILIVVFAQMSNRVSVSDLDRSVSSIHQDRLMPATYIFEISNHLYQKRLAQEHTTNTTTQTATHDESIALLIKNYESTYLTVNEKKAWSEFKASLEGYNMHYASAGYNTPEYDKAFNKVIASLSALNNIQIGESNNIQKQSKSIVGNTNMLFEFEAALLILLSLFAMVIISISDKALFFKPKKASLN